MVLRSDLFYSAFLFLRVHYFHRTPCGATLTFLESVLFLSGEQQHQHTSYYAVRGQLTVSETKSPGCQPIIIKTLLFTLE